MRSIEVYPIVGGRWAALCEQAGLGSTGASRTEALTSLLRRLGDDSADGRCFPLPAPGHHQAFPTWPDGVRIKDSVQ